MADYFTEVAAGNVENNDYIRHKFGRNTSVSTTFVPINFGGLWPTPQVGSATTLRIKAGGSINDTANGTGAREITINGFDSNGDRVVETLATNGASASASTTSSFVRLGDVHVSKSGTYATASAQSHAASITIENSAGTQDWCTIDATDFAVGRSETASCIVPRGYEGYIHSMQFTADSDVTSTNKIVEVLFLFRENILDTSAPYAPLRFGFRTSSTNNQQVVNFKVPYIFPELSDIIVMGKVSSGTTEVHVNYTLLLRNKQ